MNYGYDSNVIDLALMKTTSKANPSFEYIDKLISLQRATGLYVNELSISSLRDITWSNIFNTTTLCQQTSMLFHELKPKTFRDMVALEASAHNTTIWQKQGEMYIDFYDFTKMTSTESFKKYKE